MTISDIVTTRAYVYSGLLLAVALLLVGCSDDSPKLSPLAQNAVILAFGDSLTQGTGAGRGDSYPNHLAELSGRKVINAGIAGELSAAGLSRLPNLLAEHSPSIVILCHGGNDLLRKLDERKLYDNLSAMINQIDQSGAEVVFLGVPKPALLLGPADVYERLASEFRLVSNLKILSKILSQPKLKSDPVHPNAAGYRQLAQAVHATLSAAGAY